MAGGAGTYRYDADNMVRQAQALVELLSRSNHLFVLLLRLLWRAHYELFHLFELVDAENAPGILSVASRLLTEAR